MDGRVSGQVCSGLLLAPAAAARLLRELDVGGGDLLQLSDARAALPDDAPDLRGRDGQLHRQPHVLATTAPATQMLCQLSNGWKNGINM